MSNAFVVSRNHLVFGLCLPIAVLLGYLLAEPLESASLVVVVMVLSVLSVPLLMKWHHFLLYLSWNASIVLAFVKGSPPLWVLMVFLSLVFGVLGRSVTAERRFLQVPALNRVLLVLTVVVVGTALTSGGIGFKILGSASYGSKRYIFLLAAIAGFYALTSQAIPRRWAMWYVGAFFLSGVTAGLSNLIYAAGPAFYFLFEFFPANTAISQAKADEILGNDLVRLDGLLGFSQACTWYLLARYGAGGVLDLRRPWRVILLLAAAAASTYAGFRSGVLLFAMIFGTLFLVEGLWRTRYALYLIVAVVLAAVPTVLWVDRMPPSVQRTLSFLPLNVEPAVREAAQHSTNWRLQLWESVLPEVPRHLLHGKGYSFNPREMMLIEEAVLWGYAPSTTEGAAVAGDYHSGPLSVVLPFGIYGVIAVVWFWIVGLRVLYRNYRYGDPELRRVNGFLYAAFLARVVFFLLFYGTLYSDFFYFTGLLGLSVALNRGEAQPRPVEAEAASWD